MDVGGGEDSSVKVEGDVGNEPEDLLLEGVVCGFGDV